jgi:hypothetical protein
MTMYMNVSVSTDELGSACYDDGSFFAEVLNRIGQLLSDQPDSRFRNRVLTDLSNDLDSDGMSVIQQLSEALATIKAGDA